MSGTWDGGCPMDFASGEEVLLPWSARIFGIPAWLRCLSSLPAKVMKVKMKGAIFFVFTAGTYRKLLIFSWCRWNKKVR